MLVYLDAVICIYAVEGAPAFKARARARLATLEQRAISPRSSHPSESDAIGPCTPRRTSYIPAVTRTYFFEGQSHA